MNYTTFDANETLENINTWMDINEDTMQVVSVNELNDGSTRVWYKGDALFSCREDYERRKRLDFELREKYFTTYT
jgi:hypothetical protein